MIWQRSWEFSSSKSLIWPCTKVRRSLHSRSKEYYELVEFSKAMTLSLYYHWSLVFFGDLGLSFAELSWSMVFVTLRELGCCPPAG